MADETVSNSKDINKETASLSLGEERCPGKSEGKINKDDFSASQSTGTAAQKPEDGTNSTKVEIEPRSKENELKESCRDMFSKIAKYMEGELSGILIKFHGLNKTNVLVCVVFLRLL